MQHRKLMLAALTLSLGAVATAQTGIPKGITVAFLPKQVNNPYFATAWKGGQAAIKEFAGWASRSAPLTRGPAAR